MAWYLQIFEHCGLNIRESPHDSMVRNLPAMQETQETGIWSLGWKDTLEEGTATHYSILVWKIPWTEEPGRLQPLESQSRTRLRDWARSTARGLNSACSLASNSLPTVKPWVIMCLEKCGNHYMVAFITMVYILSLCAVLSHSVMSDSSWPHGR